VHPDDRDKAEKAMQDAVRNGSELNVEWRVIDKGGKERWLMARGKPLRNIAEQLVIYIGITIDITYRKRAELAVRGESVRRRVLFEQAKDGIVVLDHNRKVVEANKSFADMLGYTEEEMRHLHAWDWDINYSTQEQMLAVWPELPTTRDTIETRHRRKDGSVYDVEISWNPAEWDGQQQLYCVCRDITERKRAEEALQQSEHKFQVVADQTYDFESWLDPNGNYIYASPSCERIYGYGPNEFISDPSLRQRVVHPEDRARFDEHLRAVEAAHTHGEVEFRIVRNDGSVRWIEHACQPIFDEQDRYLGVRASNRDITDRKEAEAALKESAVRFHQALTAAQAGAWEVNLLTGEHTWSEELWTLFGFEPGSIKPSFDAWLETVHPDDRADARRHMEETVRTGTGFVYEWRMPNQNGKERWLMSRCTPLCNDDGQVTRLIGIVIDITERKLADKEKMKL
jgi:PAS domain S-box-containing protein